MTIVLVCWCAIFTDLPLEQVTSAQLAGESGHCAAALIGARCWAHGAMVQTITINTGHRDTLRSHSADTDGEV